MKVKLHIPVEQYGFAEFEFDGDPAKPTDSLDIYYDIARSIKGGEGLPPKEFDAFVQKQLSGESNSISDWDAMSEEQRKYIHINKRAINRINYKAEE